MKVDFSGVDQVTNKKAQMTTTQKLKPVENQLYTTLVKSKKMCAKNTSSVLIQFSGRLTEYPQDCHNIW